MSGFYKLVWVKKRSKSNTRVYLINQLLTEEELKDHFQSACVRDRIAGTEGPMNNSALVTCLRYNILYIGWMLFLHFLKLKHEMVLSHPTVSPQIRGLITNPSRIWSRSGEGHFVLCRRHSGSWTTLKSPPSRPPRVSGDKHSEGEIISVGECILYLLKSVQS